MKKIIALAVASAFVAPAFAADVSVSGDVEYQFISQSGNDTGNVGDADVKVSATEEFDGMSVSVYVIADDASGNLNESALTLTTPAGTFEIGDDNDHAAAMFDDKSDVAEANVGDAISTGMEKATTTASFSPNLGIDGLSAAISFTAEDGTTSADAQSGIGDRDDDTANETFIAYAIQYSVGGFTVSAGAVDADTEDASYENPSNFSASFAMGPFYVAYDSVDNNMGVAEASIESVGATYNYGPGKIFFETMDTQEGSNGATKAEETEMGVSYKIGPVNTYVAVQDSGADSDEKTTFGVEYAF